MRGTALKPAAPQPAAPQPSAPDKSAASRPAGPKPLLIVVSALALPLLALLAVLAFAGPAARIAPRDLPVGLVATDPAGGQIADALQQAEPGAFDLTLFGTDAAARDAIEDRQVYGALELSPGKLTVLTASAASPTVAQLLQQLGSTLAEHAAAADDGTRLTVSTSDIVPTAAADPHGSVLSSSLLPLTMCSIMIAAVCGLLLGVRPAWRQLLTIAVICALTALAAYLIAQGYLGALPGQHLETWAVLALMMYALASTVASLVALIGPPGMGLGALVLVFVGNPFSGSSSAPELLPKAVAEIGQLLPPGAGASLLRETAYFHGHGPVAHLAVLIGWSVFGTFGVFVGHHSFVGHAARRSRASSHPVHLAAHAVTGNVGQPQYQPRYQYEGLSQSQGQESVPMTEASGMSGMSGMSAASGVSEHIGLL